MLWIPRSIARVVSGCLMAAAMCITMGAQQAASPPLESQLKTIYKLSKVEWGQGDVLHRGTVLKVNNDSIVYGTPPNQVIICAATVQKGNAQPPSSFCRSMTKSSGGTFLPAGQKLYITNIKVNLPKETVTLDLAAFALDPNTGLPLMPTQKTSVNFVFQSGYLARADAGQIADAINNALPPDTPGSQAAAPFSSPPPPAPQEQAAPTAAAPMASAPTTSAPMTAAAPMAPAPIADAPVTAAVPVTAAAPTTAAAPVPSGAAPAQVELGMTEAEVKSILGPPTKANQAKGNTTVYVYHRQITFRDGKVSAIE